jgi:predicted nucleic acid-binding protein
MSVIISNTTPINYLVLIDQINVLRHLYAHVMIPQAVFGELQDEGTPGKVKAWVASHPEWLEVRTVSAPLDPMLASLDVGEREAISLVLRFTINSRVGWCRLCGIL